MNHGNLNIAVSSIKGCFPDRHCIKHFNNEIGQIVKYIDNLSKHVVCLDMIKREIETKLRKLAKKFPAIVVSGPRQSGKTTLVKNVFPEKSYVLLEDPDILASATSDPRGFLEQYPDGAILDEVQKAPVLFSYLQGVLDSRNESGLFILTGSQNYLLMEKITQSLAGRVALLNLLPFSFSELSNAKIEYGCYEEFLFNGFYPRKYDKDIDVTDFYSNYIRTYIERDVRQLKNVHDLSTFHTFLKMCAHRVGQILNLSSLANDCGITHNTAKSWISLLETAYIIYLLKPHHKNYNKRLIKAPKIYFYDTGLAAYLADIGSFSQMKNHPLKGGLFECFILTELLKKRFNYGKEPCFFYWRDKLGREIDIIIDLGTKLIALEIKSGRTVNSDFFNSLIYWDNLNTMDEKELLVIFGGADNQIRGGISAKGWKFFLNKNAFY